MVLIVKMYLFNRKNEDKKFRYLNNLFVLCIYKKLWIFFKKKKKYKKHIKLKNMFLYLLTTNSIKHNY